MKQEPLFGDKPRKKRSNRPTVPVLVEDDSDKPKYKAADDDLPLIFWPEPTFDEEVQR